MARALGDEGPEGRGGIVRGLKSFSDETQSLRQGEANFAESLISNTPDPDMTKECHVRLGWLQFSNIFVLFPAF